MLEPHAVRCGQDRGGPVQHDDSTERRQKRHKIEFYGSIALTPTW
jgi:hypothetical protein